MGEGCTVEKLKKWPGDKCRKLYSGGSTATVLSKESQEILNFLVSPLSTPEKKRLRKRKEEKLERFQSEVSNSLISRKFPADNFCQSLLTEILQRLLLPHLDRHRKRQKLTEVEASTPFQPIR
ncbi:hypothetical protein L3Y34_014888 [Caenorhabditis briggsae]|uniref:Uncharacterized protein n=1 Tax=Caenorhabditis briggsae TaxID=6238 RepID=A0AAE9IY70_CAEBR|nr:hypothetical protein L3Y34_014888 [Caenorhabditis briggsae]